MVSRSLRGVACSVSLSPARGPAPSAGVGSLLFPLSFPQPSWVLTSALGWACSLLPPHPLTPDPIYTHRLRLLFCRGEWGEGLYADSCVSLPQFCTVKETFSRLSQSILWAPCGVCGETAFKRSPMPPYLWPLANIHLAASADSPVTPAQLFF